MSNRFLIISNLINSDENELKNLEKDINTVQTLDQWETNAKSTELRDYIDKLKVNLKLS